MRRLILLLWLVPALGVADVTRLPAAAIATAQPLATDAGHAILKQGGNAFDAAVAIAATLAVVEPYNSGLGGGGFWLLHRSRDQFDVMIDARERAPLAATPTLYLDAHGDPVPDLSLNGPLAAAIPGTPAALVQIAKKFGRLPLKQSLAPAIRLARAGFALSAHDVRMIGRREAALREFPAAAEVFLDQGFLPEAGFVLRQPQLAQTLERLAAQGHDGFYAGPVAEQLVRGVRAAGGIWSRQDLSDYRVIERAPVRGVYRDIRITSAALPSSGGVVLVEALNLLRGFDLDAMDRAARHRTVIEAMRLAYRDRARFLGDPDFVPVDVPRLLSAPYADRLRREMVTAPAEAAPPRAGTGTNTTHFSIIDRDGNRAAVTLSLNGPFGSGFMPPGTGVLLNNQMDDFVAKPGVANLYGLTGSEANRIAPGKRPLSSMTPTFLESPNAVVVLGTPGGSRIINMVLLATLEFAQGRGGLRDWTTGPRFHHQYLPDQVDYETGAFTPDDLRALEAMGYKLNYKEARYGNMQAVAWDKKQRRLDAVSDPRGQGSARVE